MRRTGLVGYACDQASAGISDVAQSDATSSWVKGFIVSSGVWSPRAIMPSRGVVHES
jgi:hypothetical protein